MIIAHLARACYPFHPYGGLEQHVYHLTLELARLEQTVHLFTQPPDFADASVDDPAWRANVQHHPIPYSAVKILRRNSIPDRLVNYPLFSLRLGQAVSDMSPRPQIVHAHGLAGWGVARHSGAVLPLVLNPHGMEEFKGQSRAKRLAYAPFRELLRRTACRASSVIATDKTLLPEVERFLKVEPARLALIPNAVALDELDALTARADLAEITRRFGIGSYLLLSVGRLEANKGFEVGLQAVAQARANLDALWPGWSWLLVGQGSQRAVLERLAARLGLSDRVRWAGAVDEPTLHGLYELATVFFHPTLYEGSSLVTLEALAHRRPVVASAAGGLPDKIFESGIYANGRLAAPGDAAALAHHLLELAALDADQRAVLGQNGRTLVEHSFSWNAAARQTVQLYQSLLTDQR